MASQANLPSVGKSQGEVGLQEEVFNILPGTVNTTQGATVYQLPDQVFSFQKQVKFGDRPNQPDLRSDADLGEQVPPPLSSHNMPHSSMPYRVGVIHVNLLNHTFDVSGISPLTGNPQDAATIAAEVSAAAAAQASKEFQQMQEPKITKFKGRYSADAKLVFLSWWADILSHIQDHELDNKSVIQLIKEQTLENAHHEVEF